MSGQPRGVWWLSPPGAVVLIVPITLWLAFSFDDARFRSAYGTPKSLTDATATLFAVGALMFAITALIPLVGRRRDTSGTWPDLSARELGVLQRSSTVLFRVTMVGYLAFGVVGVARGARLSDFVAAATSQDNFGSPLRDLFAPVAGITTLTQVGIAYAVVSCLVLSSVPDGRLVRRLVLVFALALLRTFFLAERLAVLEVAIPAVTVLALWTASRRTGVGRRVVRLAPVLLVPSVIALFSVFEYSRSWVFYSQTSRGSFADFAVERLAGYYATAYNNGQLALTYNNGDARLPYGSAEAFWTAPVVSQLHLYERLTGSVQPDDYDTILRQYGNPEFNSTGGLAIPFVDYGVVGGLVFFLVAGLAIGFTYRRCCEGRAWAYLLYPVAVVGLFELPRYLYWGQGRVAPAVVCLLLVHWRLQRSRRPEPAVALS